ncbi:hypothetical protein K488DRAFT_75301, partial [Vararia minispora EC-137]
MSSSQLSGISKHKLSDSHKRSQSKRTRISSRVRQTASAFPEPTPPVSGVKKQTKTFPPTVSTPFRDIRLLPVVNDLEFDNYPGNKGSGLVLELINTPDIKDLIKKYSHLLCIHFCSPSYRHNLYLSRGNTWKRHVDNITFCSHAKCTPDCSGWVFLSSGWVTSHEEKEDILTEIDNPKLKGIPQGLENWYSEYQAMLAEDEDEEEEEE